MENNEQEPVALTSNTTKVCDVSITTIYRENSPTIYAHLKELEFHCIYCQPLPVMEFPLYTKPCNKCKDKKGKCFKNKTQSIKPKSIKPSKTSPPLAPIAEMGEKL